MITVVSGAAILVGYALLYATARASTARSFADFQHFVLGYVVDMDMFPGDKEFTLSSIPRALLGLSQAIFSASVIFRWDALYETVQKLLPAKFLIDDRYLIRNLDGAQIGTVVASMVLLVITILATLIARIRICVARARNRVFVVMASWFVLQAGFFTWWEAGSNEFWISSLVPLAICLHMLLYSYATTTLQAAFGTLACLSLLAGNGLGAILPLQEPNNDYWLANKAYLKHLTRHDTTVTYDSHTPRLSAQYFSSIPTVDLFPHPGHELDEEEVFRTLDRTVATSGRIVLDPRAVRPDRVTLILGEHFNPSAAKRYPELLRDIVFRYSSHIDFPPLLVARPDDPQPIVRAFGDSAHSP